MADAKFLDSGIADLLIGEGYFMARYKGDRGICGVKRFVYTVAIVFGLDETGYRGRWCYHTMHEAVDEFQKWDGIGDPGGDWIKYKGEGGEYSNPNT